MHPTPPQEIRTPPPRFPGDPGISRPCFCGPRLPTTSGRAPVLGAGPRSGAPGRRISRRLLDRRSRPPERHNSLMTVRLGLAVALLASLIVASAGLAWDIAWHTYIGRDSFLTPPHAVLYGGVAATGVVVLVGVLLETWRRGPGTTSFLRVFRAPLGMFVTGFGVLTLVVSAPLDNYWHELYGIDVTLWAPFHVMGLVGGLIAVLGVVYVFASERVRRGPAGIAPVALLALLLFTWSAALRGLLVIFQEALIHSPTTILGPV